MKRLNAHLCARRIVDKSQIKLILNVTKEMLPNVEQLAIARCNGGKAVGGGASQLANKINAINKSRRDELSSLNTTLEALLRPALTRNELLREDVPEGAAGGGWVVGRDPRREPGRGRVRGAGARRTRAARGGQGPVLPAGAARAGAPQPG